MNGSLDTATPGQCPARRCGRVQVNAAIWNGPKLLTQDVVRHDLDRFSKQGSDKTYVSGEVQVWLDYADPMDEQEGDLPF
jgi:hypothetical protein